MAQASVFDTPEALQLVEARQATVRTLLAELRQKLGMQRVIDVGCGVGHFSAFLHELGFEVAGVDGREENVQKAKARYPQIQFQQANVEDALAGRLGTFDLVFCMGLLYHLENPFRAIRNLYAIADKLLLIETMCVPSSQPTMDLLDEGAGENQGMNHVAFCPSESCLMKMLYRAGFPFVYRFERLPKGKPFTTTLWRKKSRTFLAASKVALTAPNLLLTEEPSRPVPSASDDPWSTPISRLLGGRWSTKMAKLGFPVKPERRGASSASFK